MLMCFWVQARLLLYLTKEVGAREAARIVSHLEHCDHCTQVLEALAESHLSIKEAIQVTETPSRKLDDAILARIQEPYQSRSATPYRQPRHKRLRLVLNGVSIALLIMVGFIWGRQNIPFSMPPVQRLDLTALTDAHHNWEIRSNPNLLEKSALQKTLTREMGVSILPLEMTLDTVDLKAGKIVRIQQYPVATLHYDWKGTKVTLAQADSKSLPMPVAQHEMQHNNRCFVVQRIGDLTYVLWCEGNSNFVLLANLPSHTLFALACQVCEQIEAI